MLISFPDSNLSMASYQDSKAKKEQEDQVYGLDDPGLEKLPIENPETPELVESYECELNLYQGGVVTLAEYTQTGHLITNPCPPLDWTDERKDMPPVPPLRGTLGLRLRVLIGTSAESNPSVVAYNLEHLSRVNMEFMLNNLLEAIGFPNAASDNLYFADSCLLPWVINAPFPFFTEWVKAKEVMLTSHLVGISQVVSSHLLSETPSVDQKLHFRLQCRAQQDSIKLCLMAIWDGHPQDVLEADAKFVSEVECWFPDGLMKWRDCLVPIPTLQVERDPISLVRIRSLNRESFATMMANCYST